MTKRFLLILAICGFAFAGFSQTIRGKIIDSATNKPIAGASIYVNGSYNGTSSGADGAFKLDAPKDKVPVMITHIGYESQKLVNYTDSDIVVLLKPKEKILNEVTIGYNAREREQELKVFKQKFLGSTSDKDCVIENPDDIDFSYYRKNDSLVAKADKPLIIKNKRLGYKITYFLAVFSYMPGRIHYGGNYFFKEDTAGLSERELANVKRFRNAAYWGSRMHFIRCLWNKDLKGNWFDIWAPTGIVGAADVLEDKNGDRYFYPGAMLAIQYLDDVTGVRAIKPGSGSYITASGYSDGNISWFGEMGFDRVAKLLPFEFEPTNAKTHL